MGGGGGGGGGGGVASFCYLYQVCTPRIVGRRKPNATDCTPAQTIYTHECWCIIIYHPGDDGDVCPEGEVRYVWNFGFLFIYIYIYMCIYSP